MHGLLMPAEPFDWNAVVIGAWNPAILTPEGIARRLFDLPPGTPVELQVPLDRQAPMRVMYGDVMVTPASHTLIVAPTRMLPEVLQAATAAAGRAIERLPETPVTAAGVNVRYRFQELPDRILEDLAGPIDDRLSDSGHTIAAKLLRRSLVWEGGLLNVEVQENSDGSGQVQFNFHLNSQAGEALREWLGRSPAMVAAAREILTTILGVIVD
jgi:hypothetical protein